MLAAEEHYGDFSPRNLGSVLEDGLISCDDHQDCKNTENCCVFSNSLDLVENRSAILRIKKTYMKDYPINTKPSSTKRLLIVKLLKASHVNSVKTDENFLCSQKENFLFQVII